jgi:subtilisin family serine protease
MLESRVLLSAAQDITSVTALRADPTFAGITGQGIGIAVLDTGVYAQNPDLEPNIKAFYNAVEDPVNSPIDPNFLQDAYDHVGHGTHVSGIAASSNPAIGVAYQASLIDIRVFADTGENQLPGDPIDRGLQWVALHASQYNIKVVNMSLGEPGINLNYTPQLDQEGQDIATLEAMGITVVTASGNDYANDPELGASIPAVESTISVGNTWADNGDGTYDFSGWYGSGATAWYAHETMGTPDTLQATSQRSSLFNQVVAPGTNILSTWNSPIQLFNTDTGTSMASPFVAGLVALMQQAAFQYGGRYLTPSEVLQTLRSSGNTLVDNTIPTDTRAMVQNDGTLGTPQPLPGTGADFIRVNALQAVEATQQLVQGHTGLGADLNNLISDATVTTPLNGTNSDATTGAVGTDGTVTVGPNDIDLYKVTLQAAGDLTISTNPTAGTSHFNLALELFDSTGNLIYGPIVGSSATYPTLGTPIGTPLAVGTYYLGVSSDANTAYNVVNGSGIANGNAEGGYSVSIVLSNPDPHGVPAAGDPLSVSSPNTVEPTPSLGDLPATHISGVIGEEIDSTGNTILVPDGDVHFYQVTAPDNGEFSIDASADVRVFDATNTPVGTEGSHLVIPVTGGQVYYVGVTTQQNAGFDPVDPYSRVPGSTPPTAFDLYVAFTNGDLNGTITQATASTLATPIAAAIGTDNGAALLGANNGNKDVDFYAFTAPTSGIFDVAAAGAGGLVPEMSLWSSSNSLNNVVRLADASETNPELLEQVTAGQVVYVAVTGKGNQNYNGIAEGTGAGGQTGTYTLTTTLQPLSNLPALENNSVNNGTPTPLALNTPISAYLGRDGNLVVGPNDVDIYSFTAPATSDYQFATDTTTDGSAQTAVEVFNASGQTLAANQSVSSTSTNSVVTVAMQAGQTYYVGVSGVGPNQYAYSPLTGAGAGPGSTGSYTITATSGGPFQRSLTLQQGAPVTYHDAAGRKITVTLHGPGYGSLIFDSTTDGADLAQLLMGGTDATSTLTFRGTTNLQGIAVTGSLRSFMATTSNLIGNLSVSGSLGTLNLGSSSGGNVISIGPGATLNATIGTLTNTSLSSSENIGFFRVNYWVMNDGNRHSLSAPLINNLTVRSAFSEDISATTIQHMTVGALSNSIITVGSLFNTLTAGSVSSSDIFAGISSTVSTLPAAIPDFANQGAVINTVTVRSSFSSTLISAWTINNIKLNGLQTANNGVPFGLSAELIKHGRVTVAGSRKPIVLTDDFAPLAPISLGGDAVAQFVG